MIIKEACEICANDDFGYCGLRHSKEEVFCDYKEGEICACTGFVIDTSTILRMFKKEIKNVNKI
jgi:hypothetical protein